jgi:preprotein translocase subunit SecG
MYTLVIVLTVIAAVLLIGVVLIQKSKGGGLSSAFAGSNQIMGVRRTNDVVEKATWTLAIAIALLSIVSVFVAPSITSSASRVVAPAATTAAPVDYNTKAAKTDAKPIAAPANNNQAPTPAAEVPAE